MAERPVVSTLAAPPQLEQPLRPVRPLRVSWLTFGVVAVLSVAAGVWLFGPLDKLRFDAPQLGVGLLWGASALQVILAAILVAHASREAVPGRRPSTLSLAVGVLGSLAVHGVISWLTYRQSPTSLPDELSQKMIGYCMRWEMLLALPILVGCCAVIALGLPSRLARVGVVLGFSAALVGDGLYRLACPISDPEHVVLAHSPALIAGAAVALGLAWSWTLLRRFLWARR